MKKNIHTFLNVVLVVLIILCILIPSVFTAAEMGIFTEDPVVTTKVKVTDKDAPVLKIATDYDFSPNSYYNTNGDLSGLYIEIMIEAANRIGMRPDFKTGEWQECRQMLEDGTVDVLLGLEIFSNMQDTLQTIPICSDDLRVYGKEKVDSVASLAGKKVALMAKSVIKSTYDLQCDYVEYNTNTEILQAVENGDVDYGICHAAVASKIIEENGLNLQEGLVIAKSYPALAVDKNATELQEKLNTALQEMSEDGTIGKLQDKWVTNFTENKSLSYVLQHNETYYMTFLICAILMFSVYIILRVHAGHQEKHINELLEYQEKMKESNDAAIRANMAKREFLSHMSHDIRTPVNGIMGMVEIIRKNKDKPEKTEEWLKKIDQASGHLLSLINDVVDMSKLENGQVQLEHVPFDLNDEMEQIKAIVEVQAEAAEIRFQIHMKDVEHTRLIGSPMHFRRILLNLISNSVKYNHPGGSVDVYIKEKSSDKKQVEYQIVIRDTGIGMSEEFIDEYLYKPFTQADDNARTSYRGTGLGMAIVSELLKTMEGNIQVYSEKDKGTTFYIALGFDINPEKEPEIVPEDDLDEKKDVKGLHVLIVEDNDLNLEITNFMLESAGVITAQAKDGKEAVEAFAASEEGEYDAILMDIMMPVMDGLEATRKIRAMTREDAKTIPIIAMTANAFAEDKVKTKEAGMNHHLTKPVDLEILEKTLGMYCEGHKRVESENAEKTEEKSTGTEEKKDTAEEKTVEKAETEEQDHTEEKENAQDKEDTQDKTIGEEERTEE